MKIINLEEQREDLKLKEELLQILRESYRFFAVYYTKEGDTREIRHNVSANNIISECEYLKYKVIKEVLE